MIDVTSGLMLVGEAAVVVIIGVDVVTLVGVPPVGVEGVLGVVTGAGIGQVLSLISYTLRLSP